MLSNSQAYLIESKNVRNFTSLGTVGLSLRKPTEGTEYKMVQEYVHSQLISHIKTGEQKVILLEPQLDSGFPDIVIVYFEPEVARNWSIKRLKVNKLDLRILHYIFSEKDVDNSALENIFPGDFYKSIRRLLSAELVHYQSGKLQAKPLEEIFAIKRLIAIEAKVKNWQEGLHQAIQNTWFASESYLLLPKLPSNSELIQGAKSFGVGIVTTHCSLVESRLLPSVGKLPKSYVSWLFNEWVWHTLFEYKH